MDIIDALDQTGDLKSLLDGEILTVADLVSQLYNKWQDLVSKAKDVYKPISEATDVLAVFDAISATLNEDIVKHVFVSAGAERLLSDLQKLAKRTNGEIPKELRALLKPLSSFEEIATGTDVTFSRWQTGNDDGSLRWVKTGDILSKTTAIGNGAVDLRLGGKVTAECEAGSLWFYGDDGVSSKGLVRIGLDGHLSAGVDGKLPFASTGVTAAAAAGCQAHLFWRKPLDQSFGSAMAEILRAPVDIFSLDKVWEASQNSDFVGAILAIDGNASVDVKLALARDLGAEGIFSAVTDLTVSVTLSRKAAYELSVLKTNTGIRLVLSHATEDAAGWGIGAGIEIDPSPLTRRVADLIAQATDYWDEALATVKPFLSPGTWLRDRMTTELDDLLPKLLAGVDDDIAAALTRDLHLALGFDSTGAGGAELLKTKLIDAVGAVKGAVTDSIEDIVTKVVSALQAQLPSLLSDPIANALKGEATGLIEKLQAAFKAETDQLSKGAAVAIAEVDKALARLGKPLADTAQSADARAKRIRDAVTAADALIHEIAAKIKEAALGKISARLSFERQRLERENYEFAGEISAVTDDLRILYRSIITGRLQAAAHLFASDAVLPAGLTLDTSRCSVRRFSKVSSKLGYEIVLLGLKFSGEAVTTGQADVTLELDGHIKVQSLSLASRANTVWADGRSTRFIQTYASALRHMDASGRLPELERGMTLDLTTQRTDANLTSNELEAYLQVAVDIGLFSADRVQKMKAYLALMAATRGRAKLPGTISISMTFSSEEVGNLVGWGNAIRPGVPPTDRDKSERYVYDFALGNMLSAGEWDQEIFIYFVESYFRPTASFHGSIPEQAKAARARLFDVRNSEPIHKESGPRATLDGQRGPGYRRWKTLRDFEQLLIALATIWNAAPRSLNDPDHSKWDEGAYRDWEAKVAEYAQEWIGTNYELFAFGKSVDQCTVALMRTLAGLARGKQSPTGSYDPMFGLSLVVSGEAKAF